MGQYAVPSGGLLVVLFILAIFGTAGGPFLALGDYWGQLAMSYLASLVLTGLSFALRRNRGDPELYQIILRLLWPPALIGTAGLASLLPEVGGFLAGLITTATVILTVVWSVISLVEAGLSILSAGQGTGSPEGSSLRQRIFNLLDQLYLSGSRLKYTLEPGERIMFVLLESPFKAVYPRTMVAGLKSLPLGAGISASIVAGWMLLSLLGNIKAIIAGHFNMGGTVVASLILGTAITALIALPVIFWNWYIESWNRNRRRWIFSNRHIWMVSVQAPLTVPEYSDGPLDAITEIPIRPLNSGKTTNRVSPLLEFWSGLAYRLAQTANVVLPSRLMGATDTLTVDHAIGVKQIITALGKKAREMEALKRVAREAQARAALTQQMEDMGVSVRSQDGTAEDIAAAYAELVGASDGEQQQFDPWTVPDPGICDPKSGTIATTTVEVGNGAPDMSLFQREVVMEVE